jgi:hypothetical protein
MAAIHRRKHACDHGITVGGDVRSRCFNGQGGYETLAVGMRFSAKKYAFVRYAIANKNATWCRPYRLAVCGSAATSRLLK